MHTKPVLKAILNKDYEPVLEIHKLFIAGGSKRENLKEYSCRRGIMCLKHVEEITSYLKEWCLRGGMSTSDMINMDKNAEDTLNQRGVVLENQRENREEENTAQTTQDIEDTLEKIDCTGIGRIGAEIRSLSPAITEVMPASQDEIPPCSSFPSTKYDKSLILEDSFVSLHSNVSSAGDTVPTSGRVSEVCSSIHGYNSCEGLSPFISINTDDNPNLTNLNKDQTVHGTCRPPRQRGCEEYEALSDLEKLHVSIIHVLDVIGI